MIKKSTSLLFISLLLLISYHYIDTTLIKLDSETQLVSQNINEIKSNNSSEFSTKDISESEDCSDCNKKNSLFNEKVKKIKKKSNNPLIKKIKNLKKKYGDPTNIQKIDGNSIYNWDFLENKPWNKIVYNYNNDFPYYFFIKARINNLDEYQKWKKILPNLDFDPKRKSLIIQTKDETTALAVANIILSNLQGKIELKEIIEKQLIPISINRAKKYDMVKNNLKQQLIETINGSPNKEKTKMLDYSEDLATPKNAKSKKNTDGPIAGNEFYNLPTKNEGPLAAMQVSGDSSFSFI